MLRNLCGFKWHEEFQVSKPISATLANSGLVPGARILGETSPRGLGPNLAVFFSTNFRVVGAHYSGHGPGSDPVPNREPAIDRISNWYDHANTLVLLFWNFTKPRDATETNIQPLFCKALMLCTPPQSHRRTQWILELSLFCTNCSSPWILEKVH